MSTPESVLAGYDDKSKEGKLVIQRVKTLTNRYKRTGINKENICGIVSTLMMEVNKIKTLSGQDKKELVIDLIYSIIEEIDEGEEDSEIEVVLKKMVPPMIDSFSVMLKVTKGCGCFGK
tara:strand:- start:1163 stop:1519 length:357 start_codon:yes stop_codon:yes gene_type:complete